MNAVLDDRSAGELRRIATRIRRLTLETVHNAGAGHTGGSLSIAETLAVLYWRILNIDPARPKWEERDRFVLSKGHAAVGLYAALALRGYFPEAMMAEFDQTGGRLPGHPDMLKTPGVDMSTGSLGQGLSVGIGMAMGARRRGIDCHTTVMMGDGEMQEGQIWEAIMYAGFHKSGRLLAIVDANALQLTGRTAEVLDLEPLGEKVAAFGWEVSECDGHDVRALYRSLATAKAVTGRPAMVIARTEKGHGVSFIAGRVEWHAKAPTEEQLAQATEELRITEKESGVRSQESE